jgi:hypothetical protein
LSFGSNSSSPTFWTNCLINHGLLEVFVNCRSVYPFVLEKFLRAAE